MSLKPKVVISILHIPHLNFFKNAIFELEKLNLEVHLIVRPRGNLEKVFKAELGDRKYKIIGKHSETFTGKIFDIIKRDFELIKYLKTLGNFVGLSCGDHCLTHACKILGNPSISFSDDLLEYKMGYYLFKYTCDSIVIPDSIPISRDNVFKFKGSKQLAYLHPKYFTPSSSVLEEYNVKENNYVFMREISNSSLNYSHLETGISKKLIRAIRNKGYKILLSLEDKSKAHKYSKFCQILKEPVSDIFSLIKFAAFSICSGDSMARESGVLGTPCVYVGGRDMHILEDLYKRDIIFNANSVSSAISIVENIIEHNLKTISLESSENAIKNEWHDTTQVILDHTFYRISGEKSLISKYRGNN